MELVYKRPESLSPYQSMFCPGCHQGIVYRLIAEVIDELGIRERAVLSHPIGCGGQGCITANYDTLFSLHGRGSAASTALKLLSPESVVVCYQGDGDAASIGTAETVHVARRGDPVTVIVVNNGVFGMTGGQVSPTTLVGERTITTKQGNQTAPINLAEMIATLDAPDYVARCAVNTPKNIIACKKAIRHGLERQMEGKYSMIEVLASCVTSTRLKPEETPKYVDNIIKSNFPLGEFKRDGEKL
jgi:2-oxoglutarate/2-oxoacid ferredoxin oxidoreductase subunit beta